MESVLVTLKAQIQRVLFTMRTFDPHFVLWTRSLGNTSLECAVTLWEKDFLDPECLPAVISGALSLIMMGISIFYKVPVIAKIVSAGQAKGLDPNSMYMETLAYISRVFYHVLQADALMVYGDLVSIMVQNFIIVLLMWCWGIGKGPMTRSDVTKALAAMVLVLPTMWYIGTSFETGATMLLTYSTLVTVSSRAPQIYANMSADGPGVQVWQQYMLGAGGCAAKCFVNRGDVFLLCSDGLAGVLNFILMCQTVYLTFSQVSKKKRD